MSELLFIRHAQTDFVGSFCGHSDPPANDIGRRQIAALVETLGHESIGAVYSSDLLRAHTTAQAIAQVHSVPLIPLAQLREIYFGDWEGLTWLQVEQRDPAYAQLWTADFPRIAAPNGEAFRDFEERIVEAVTTIAAESDARRIAVVTHAGVMRVILQKVCGFTEEQAWRRTQAYCSSFSMNSAVPEVFQ